MKSRFLAVLLFFAAATLCAQYKAALPGYQFEFPRDYFNHDDYQTEWWYYTGNLKSADGRRFGFELTFFRQGVSRKPSNNAWFVRDLWMAHLALSDIAGQRFYHQERLNRSGPELAGVDAQTALVWNGNWQAHISDHEQQLRATAPNFSIALTLASRKSPVIHGQDGISRKSEDPGHASHYFSLTRLATTGSIELEGKTYQVEGASWMDHEFFTGSMAPNQTGWDWLSAQLDDGTELMLYRLRRADGSIDPASSGSFVDAAGHTQFLSSRDFAMTPAGDIWTSPATHANYPVRWHVSIPRLNLELEITTPLRPQEMTGHLGPTYWEGAVDIAGTRSNAPIKGAGYLEMTGYAEPGKAVLPR